MQNVSTDFNRLAQSDLRPLNWGVLISFAKDYDPDIDFFTIGVSLIGGSDFIRGEADVVQDWDKYTYQDLSDRLISIEWSNQTEQFASTTMAIADIVLDNFDGLFTPGGNSEIANYIKPYRPIRLMAGFGDELIPVFIGLTEKMPTIDEKGRTASFHCIDFLSSLYKRPLDQTVMFVSQRTDEVIQSLFEFVGLTAGQLDLDIGFTTVPFIYFPKGTKLGDALTKLLQAEDGRLFLSEQGVITFRNRQSYDSGSVYSFNAYQSIDDQRTKVQDNIINVVQIKGKIRAVQPKQHYWRLQSAIEIPAGGTVEIWADFQDPVTSIDDPVYIDNAPTSYFKVETASFDGFANSVNVTLIDTELYATSYKMTFSNSAAVTLFITDLQLFVTPAVVTNDVYIREEDTNSVEEFDERLLEINNDFFQDQTEARSKALVILADQADFGGLDQVEVKGNMALQMGDTVTVDVFGRIGQYKITRIMNRIMLPGRYTQVLSLRQFEPRSYFTIGVSLIGGTDQIRP